MHTLLDYDSLLTEFVNITDGKCGNNRGALNIPVPPHSVVVADRGYCDVGRHRRLADPSRPWAKTCHGLYGRGSCSQAIEQDRQSVSKAREAWQKATGKEASDLTFKRFLSALAQDISE